MHRKFILLVFFGGFYDLAAQSVDLGYFVPQVFQELNLRLKNSINTGLLEEGKALESNEQYEEALHAYGELLESKEGTSEERLEVIRAIRRLLFLRPDLFVAQRTGSHRTYFESPFIAEVLKSIRQAPRDANGKEGSPPPPEHSFVSGSESPSEAPTPVHHTSSCSWTFRTGNQFPKPFEWKGSPAPEDNSGSWASMADSDSSEASSRQGRDILLESVFRRIGEHLKEKYPGSSWFVKKITPMRHGSFCRAVLSVLFEDSKCPGSFREVVIKELLLESKNSQFSSALTALNPQKTLESYNRLLAEPSLRTWHSTGNPSLTLILPWGFYWIDGHPKRHFEAMDMAPGEPLTAYLKTLAKYEQHEAIRDLLSDLGRLLADFHVNGFVHGDSHLGNIIFNTDTGLFYLIDCSGLTCLGSQSARFDIESVEKSIEQCSLKQFGGSFMDGYLQKLEELLKTKKITREQFNRLLNELTKPATLGNAGAFFD